MRAIVSAFLFIAALGFSWAIQTPTRVYLSMHAIEANRGDPVPAEESLLRLGQGAVPALREGLRSPNSTARDRFAKLLAVLGENEGEAFLLDELHAHPDADDAAGGAAESFLLAAWDRRDGPDDMMRQRLFELERDRSRISETLTAFNEILARYPGWADGFARRARLFQMAGEAFEAKRDALSALARAPNHFEALITLGRVQLSVDAPQHAYKCFERALLVNPRLKNSLKNDLRDTLKALDAEKEKRRDDKRKNTPVV